MGLDGVDDLLPPIVNNDGPRFPTAGIEGVEPHPDGDAAEGGKPQGQKKGGLNQAGDDFNKATGGKSIDLGNGGRRGRGPNGENVIIKPESSGTPGNPIRYIP